MSLVKHLLGKKKTHYDNLVFHWSPGQVEVHFPNSRHQVVHYEASAGTIVFRSTAATAKTVEHIGYEPLTKQLLIRNRVTEVVTFGFGKRGRVEATIVQNIGTLQPEELRFYLGLLARETDRLEYVLTGRDRY